MTAEQFLDRLERVRPAGDSMWSAACPAHDDRVASLSIAIGRDDCLLLRCHAGCTTPDIVDVLGLRLKDLFPEEQRPTRVRKGVLRVPAASVQRPLPMQRARRIPAAVDEQDIIRWAARLQDHPRLLERIRARKGWSASTLDLLGIGFDGRRLTFPVRAHGSLLGVLRYLPDGDPKMLASRGAPRELWPAPESLPAGPIVLVEGEPDAVSGAQLGLPTVAVPGAATWRTSWAQRLADRVVIVVCDCDEPGRTAAARTMGELGAHSDVRLIDLDPERTDGHDLGDEVAQASRNGELFLRSMRRHLLHLAGLDEDALVHSIPRTLRRTA